MPRQPIVEVVETVGIEVAGSRREQLSSHNHHCVIRKIEVQIVDSGVRAVSSMLAWCSDIAASDNARRPYVPPSELPAVLQSTPEEVAREILMGVAPGFMDFPEGKILAEWHEFQNSEKVEPAYKNLLTRHSPERLSKSFPNFNPVFDRVRYSPKTGREVVLHDYSRIYKLRFPSGADIGAICEKLKSMPGVLFAEPNQIVYPGAVPDDPYFLGTTLPGPQWNLDRINMRDAWDLSKGDYQPEGFVKYERRDDFSILISYRQGRGIGAGSRRSPGRPSSSSRRPTFPTRP